MIRKSNTRPTIIEERHARDASILYIFEGFKFD